MLIDGIFRRISEQPFVVSNCYLINNLMSSFWGATAYLVPTLLVYYLNVLWPRITILINLSQVFAFPLRQKASLSWYQREVQHWILNVKKVLWLCYFSGRFEDLGLKFDDSIISSFLVVHEIVPFVAGPDDLDLELSKKILKRPANVVKWLYDFRSKFLPLG